MVSVSVSTFETKDKSLNISLNFLDEFIKSQSQNLIPILKVSVSVSKIETGLHRVSVSVSTCKNWSHTSLSIKFLYKVFQIL